MSGSAAASGWPALRVADWEPTRDTLHMWTQIVGKIRLSQAPLINHWWQVTLYVSPRGLTTSSIPDRNRLFDMEFDFIDHILAIRTSDGESRTVTLAPKSVSEFYTETLTSLGQLGIEPRITARTQRGASGRYPSPTITNTLPTTPRPRICFG